MLQVFLSRAVATESKQRHELLDVLPVALRAESRGIRTGRRWTSEPFEPKLTRPAFILVNRHLPYLLRLTALPTWHARHSVASLTLHTLSDSLTLGLVSVETICRQAFWCRRQRPQPVQILARKEFLRTTGQRDEKNTHAQGQRCSRRAHDRSIVPLVAGRHTLAPFVQ